MDDSRECDSAPDEGDIEDLIADLADLQADLDDADARERVGDVIEAAASVTRPNPTFGRVVTGYGRDDVAEAFLGSVLFGIPMAVEGGTQEVGAFVSTHPVFLAVTILGTVALVVGVLYVADIQDVRVVEPLFGFVPRRLVGVTAVSFGTAAALLTAWGRVSWTDPWLAVCTTAVAFVPMAIGAALGDILPGS